jgi:TolA-binding protein
VAKKLSLLFFFPVLAISLAVCLFADPARAMTAYWGQHPQKERLVFHFRHAIPEFFLRRTGPQEITLSLPEHIWEREVPPDPMDMRNARLLQDLAVNGPQIRVHLKTDAFGFVFFPYKGENKLIIDLFRDPDGAKWSPAEAEDPSESAEQKTSASQENNQVLASSENATGNQQDDHPAQSDQKSFSAERPKSPLSDENTTIAQTTNGNASQATYWLRAPVSWNALEETPSPGSDQAGVHPAPEQPLDQKGQEPEQDGVSGNRSGKEEKPDLDSDNATKNQNPEQGDQGNAADTIRPFTGLSANATKKDFESFWTLTQAAIHSENLPRALANIQTMLAHPRLPATMTEDLLYTKADLLFQAYGQDLPDQFETIMDAYQAAVNHNPESALVPEALLNMGYMNLQVGNIPEATGYFNLLRKKYPQSPYVPPTYYYWGEYHYQRGEYQEAADSFQIVVQEYPDARAARNASIGLARSLDKLRFFKQALEIIDYIEKRWPRYYVEDPAFLTVAGHVKLNNELFAPAREDFWTYFNLRPDGEQADIALARIGDIYVLMDQKKAAGTIYSLAVERFPDREGGLIAKMRLAEEGIYDTPSIKDMFSVFDRPYNTRPKDIYTEIMTRYPQSPLAPVAMVKLAMWYLWEKNYSQVYVTTSEFLERYPDSRLQPNALQTAREAFAQSVGSGNEDFEAILTIWDKWPFLHGDLTPEARLAVATSLWKQDRSIEALEIAQPFVDGTIAFSNLTEMALNLVLNIMVSAQSWEQILELEQKARSWKLSQAGQRQLAYAQALALENLGKIKDALPLWRRLAADIALPSGQRAFALYFLAQYAHADSDLEQVYIYAQQALSLFMEEDGNEEEIKNCLDLLIRTTQRTGRMQEALGWALEYSAFVPEDSPDWPAFAYRLGTLYRNNENMQLWEKTMGRIIEKAPDSLYAQMAVSDLRSATIQKQFRQYE